MIDYKNMPFIEVPSTSYNCYDQQLMAICHFHCNEYYKLFFNEKLNIYNNYVLKSNRDYEENLKKYYNLQLKYLDKNEYYKINSINTYLVFLDVHKYKWCSNVDKDYVGGFHAVILYNIDKDFCTVYDNFYRKNDYKIPNQEFFDAVLKVWLIDHDANAEVNNIVNESATESCNNTAFEKLLEIYEKIVTWDKESFLEKDKELIDNIHVIFAYINRNAFVYESFNHENLFVLECVKALRSKAEDLRMKWYTLLKYRLKHNEVGKDVFIQKYREVLNILESEVRIKQELKNISSSQDGLREKIIHQLQNYIGQPFDLKESVYVKHNGYTVLKIINYWEDANSLSELNTLIFSKKSTYEEFIVAFYAYLLSMQANTTF